MSKTPKIAVFLHQPVYNDARVIKICSTLAQHYRIDIYFISDVEEEFKVPEQVTLIRINADKSILNKVLRHSYFGYAYMSLAKAATKRGGPQYEAIYANDLPTLLPAFICSVRQKAALIYDSHEIYTETINQFFPRKTSWIKRPVFSFIIRLMKRHGERLEKRLMPKADGFITVNNSLMDYFANRYDLKRRMVLMNLPVRISSSTNCFDFREKFGWKKTDKIFLYQGLLNEGRGLWLLLEAFLDIPAGFKLVIIGYGPLWPGLEEFVRLNNMNDRVHFEGKIPVDDLPGFTCGADFGINLLEDINLSKKLASPNKLFEYIHAGIPVLCSQTVENEIVMNKFKIGLMTKNNVDDLRKAISELGREWNKNDPDRRSEFARAKEHYCWQQQESGLLELTDQLVNEKNP